MLLRGSVGNGTVHVRLINEYLIVMLLLHKVALPGATGRPQGPPVEHRHGSITGTQLLFPSYRMIDRALSLHCYAFSAAAEVQMMAIFQHISLPGILPVQ